MAQNEELLTLSEVSNRTDISMPTLQRYKKAYQHRIPSVGHGRKQRYPEEALEVFKQIKKENIKRRGRPRKDASKGEGRRKPGRKKKAETGGDRQNLLTLTQVSEETGISYPTLVRYMKLHGDQVPHEGEGRRRRYYPEAIEVFRRLREESPRGRRRKSDGRERAGKRASRGGGGDGDLSRRVQSLERSQEKLEKQIRSLIKHLQKPMKVTIQRQ